MKNIFIEKTFRKCALRTSPRPLFNFGKLPIIANACKKLLKIKHLERDLSKGLTKVNLIYSFVPSSFL